MTDQTESALLSVALDLESDSDISSISVALNDILYQVTPEGEGGVISFEPRESSATASEAISKIVRGRGKLSASQVADLLTFKRRDVNVGLREIVDDNCFEQRITATELTELAAMKLDLVITVYGE